MEPRRWRQGLPAAMLLVGVLPFGEHMETFIGYPLRLATARLTSQTLSALGISSLGMDTILIFENGLSQVDSPCSGLKSLWTGGLFLLAATWIEGRPINRRWLLVAMAFVAMLFVSNLARVTILVLVGQVGDMRLLAEMLHVPLGMIGFAAACAATIGLLRWLKVNPSAETTAPRALPVKPRWLAPSLAGLFILFVLLYVPPPQPAAAASFTWQFPEGLAAEAWPLDSIEMKWLTNDGSTPLTASRWRFTWDGTGKDEPQTPENQISGSLLIIASDTWRAHHRPERCFSVYGLEIQESRLHMVSQDFPLRWLTLGDPQDSRTLYTAGYWLQSSQRLTDDYSVRIWDDMAPHPQPWVMVIVVFDANAGGLTPTSSMRHVDPTEADVEALFLGLRQTVQDGLQASQP
jgi:exosortase O